MGPRHTEGRSDSRQDRQETARGMSVGRTAGEPGRAGRRSRGASTSVPGCGSRLGDGPCPGAMPQSLGPAAPGCHTHMWPPGATFPSEAQPPPTAWISVLDLPGEGAQWPGAQVKAPRLFSSQIPLEANDRVQREPRGSGPQLPTPTHCVCRGGTRVATDPSPPREGRPPVSLEGLLPPGR